jgi:Zn-dependent M28 family amino/carboxypeptidase
MKAVAFKERKMRAFVTMLLCFGLIAVGRVNASGCEPNISAQNIKEMTRFLSDDLMEGRGPGTRGGELAAKYIADQFILTGLAPANGDSYFQNVPMIGVTVVPPASLEFVDKRGQKISPEFGKDFVGWPTQGIADLASKELVFVGYGVNAPEVPWNDYKGQSVKGKILLMLVNDPPSDDPKFFGGKALTYYGRWTYKFEEAARQGAVGAILIHNTDMAGYPWQVVETSWSGEQFKLPTEEVKSTLIEGWIQQAVAEKLFESAGLTFERAREMAGKADFSPLSLGVTVNVHMKSETRKIESPNVVAKLEGVDPKLKDEVIIITSHWDHLGIGKPVNGDAIYNGALDNASGVAGLIELARVMSLQPEKPKRSIIFAALTGEEQGLLGSAYYAAHPLVPLSKTALDVNFDAINVWGRTSNLVASGTEYSTGLAETVAKVAREMKVEITPDPQPEKGSFFRSDQFSLVKVGVPAAYIRYGLRFEGKSEDWGEKLVNDYTSKNYHQPSDQFDPSWSFEGAVQMMEFSRRLVTYVANADAMPQWNAGSPFQRPAGQGN